MVTRRYRVGIDIDKYAKRFIVGCIVSFLFGACLCTTMVSAIMLRTHEAQVVQMNERFESAFTEQEAIFNAEKDAYIVEIETLETENSVLEQRLNNAIAEKDQILELQQADFELLQKYWYVLKEAEPGSGLTLEVLRFADEECQKWDINPDWMWHVYQHESHWTTNIDNYAGSGARGLGQVMPSAGKEMWERILGHGAGTFTLDMLYDPYVNVEITVAIIGRNMEKYDSMATSLKLYSGGSSSYYDVIVGMAAEHGITLTENNTHYPQ